MNETTCQDIFSQNPTCADSSWILWNTTTQGQYNGFFCCEAGQVGDVNGYCHAASEDLNPDLEGIIVSFNYLRSDAQIMPDG